MAQRSKSYSNTRTSEASVSSSGPAAAAATAAGSAAKSTKKRTIKTSPSRESDLSPSGARTESGKTPGAPDTALSVGPSMATSVVSLAKVGSGGGSDTDGGSDNSSRLVPSRSGVDTTGPDSRRDRGRHALRSDGSTAAGRTSPNVPCDPLGVGGDGASSDMVTVPSSSPIGSGSGSKNSGKPASEARACHDPSRSSSLVSASTSTMSTSSASSASWSSSAVSSLGGGGGGGGAAAGVRKHSRADARSVDQLSVTERDTRQRSLAAMAGGNRGTGMAVVRGLDLDPHPGGGGGDEAGGKKPAISGEGTGDAALKFGRRRSSEEAPGSETNKTASASVLASASASSSPTDAGKPEVGRERERLGKLERGGSGGGASRNYLGGSLRLLIGSEGGENRPPKMSWEEDDVGDLSFEGAGIAKSSTSDQAKTNVMGRGGGGDGVGGLITARSEDGLMVAQGGSDGRSVVGDEARWVERLPPVSTDDRGGMRLASDMEAASPSATRFTLVAPAVGGGAVAAALEANDDNDVDIGESGSTWSTAGEARSASSVGDGPQGLLAEWAASSAMVDESDDAASFYDGIGGGNKKRAPPVLPQWLPSPAELPSTALGFMIDNNHNGDERGKRDSAEEYSSSPGKVSQDGVTGRGGAKGDDDECASDTNAGGEAREDESPHSGGEHFGVRDTDSDRGSDAESTPSTGEDGLEGPEGKDNYERNKGVEEGSGSERGDGLEAGAVVDASEEQCLPTDDRHSGAFDDGARGSPDAASVVEEEAAAAAVVERDEEGRGDDGLTPAFHTHFTPALCDVSQSDNESDCDLLV